MKSLLTIMALALIAVMPAAFADDHAMMDKMDKEAQKLDVVVFYSDTCGSCKILEPKMMDAMAVLNKDSFNVIKFDFSNKETIAKTRAMATENNVDATLQAYGAKTGFVVLLDNDGNEIEKLTVNDSAADIAAKLTSSVLSLDEKA